MRWIENQTPYIGKTYLRFEKMPYYESGGKSGMLNKIHLDLGFTKLVSRFITKQNLDGKILDPKKVDLINRYTWGEIGTYNFKEFKLENSFIHNGTYIDDARKGWWYFKNKMIVCTEFPNGVAIKLKAYHPNNKLKNSIKDRYENYLTEQIENENIDGYYGYSHRGGSIFKIGDRLFQEDYEPIEEDYTKKEWAKFTSDFQKLLKKSDDLEKKWAIESGISHVVPFLKRGHKVIENWEEAKIAARNLSSYLS